MNTPAQRLAQAWALKDACYEAWARAPALAVQAAQDLAGLDRRGLPPPDAAAIEGLCAWTAGIAAVTRGQFAEAVAAFDDAQAHLTGAQQPDAAAQTQVPKIMALSLLGRHEEATACAGAARQALAALGNHAAAARVGLNLAGLLLHRDAYAESAREYRGAAVLFARAGDQLHSVLADIGLAAALTSLGDFDEALRIYARARMRAHTHHLEQPLAMVDESVALVDLARGRYSEALVGLESARRRFETLGLPHALAIAEKHLADAYLELRLLPEALALFDSTAVQFQRQQMPEEQAWSLAQRGRAQALMAHLAAATASFTEAAQLFRAQDHLVGLSSVILAQAELALAAGDPAAALAQATEAAAGFREAGHSDGSARAELIHAQALLARGQTQDARTAFGRTLAMARQRQQRQVQVRCLTGVGMSARALGDAPAARAALEEAIELLEDQRRALPGDELRGAFLTDRLLPYQERLALALAGGDAREVMVQLERCRARSLADHLHEGRSASADGPADGTADFLFIDPALRERVNWLTRRVQQLQDEREPSAALESELRRTERDLLEQARRQRLSQGAAGGSSAQLDLAALQSALGPQDALVEYGVVGGELFALVLRANSLHLLRGLAHWPDVSQALHSARLQIESLRHGTATMQLHAALIQKRTQARLSQLHALVWAPLHAALAGSRRVLIVPHGPMAALPFAALAGSEGVPLGHQLALALAPSAQAAAYGLRRQALKPRRVLALGESSQLPHAAAEAQAVAALFADGQSLTGAAATVAGLQAAAGTADVVHLACHAQFRRDNPRFSALHLADGLLTVEATESLRLKPGLVVLSACETALSDDGGDEQVGLVRAFLVAGAARVIASLWPVSDEVSADFMRSFYGHLAAGQAPSEALLRAQRHTAQGHPEPFHWAAFVLFGGW